MGDQTLLTEAGEHYKHLYHIEHSNQKLLFKELNVLNSQRDELRRFLRFVELHLSDESPKPSIEALSVECKRLVEKYVE